MGINERVVSLISNTANSKKAFSELTGISTVILSHISSGRNKVSLAAVEQILLAFPNVNAEWLVLGKGKMFKDDLNNTKVQEVIAAIDYLQLQLIKQNKSIDSNINRLKELITE